MNNKKLFYSLVVGLTFVGNNVMCISDLAKGALIGALGVSGLGIGYVAADNQECIVEKSKEFWEKEVVVQERVAIKPGRIGLSLLSGATFYATITVLSGDCFKEKGCPDLLASAGVIIAGVIASNGVRIISGN